MFNAYLFDIFFIINFSDDLNCIKPLVIFCPGLGSLMVAASIFISAAWPEIEREKKNRKAIK
jgi:hypothetical protein